ncbi:hypothetical protein FEM48_Zijuj05G0012300 [Ziziphus jujuba var. spinosa]|uniref:Uncharacterized protein n=1 Tax=Ziziphus jujuba var. spinosa TaxID=714518 RepID=A0A978VBY0_ZIZJJ|nr:hypothetical protein FEM48_Zijuj05G0012300 [Ziziphus jujuba var. spinosa]
MRMQGFRMWILCEIWFQLVGYGCSVLDSSAMQGFRKFDRETMFMPRYLGRTLFAAAKSETSAATAAASSSARTVYNPLEEFFEADRSPDEEKPVLYGEEVNVRIKHVLTERAIEEPDPRRSAEMKRMINALWWLSTNLPEAVLLGIMYNSLDQYVAFNLSLSLSLSQPLMGFNVALDDLLCVQGSKETISLNSV